MAEFMPTSTPNRGQPFSPTIASRVRPGGALAFSEPMSFSPTAGGWITQSQLSSRKGVWSPSSDAMNYNVASASPPSKSPVFSAADVVGMVAGKMMAPEAIAAAQMKNLAKIKHAPSEMAVEEAYANNPFSFPSYWSAEADKRGWYDKPGQAYGRKL